MFDTPPASQYPSRQMVRFPFFYGWALVGLGFITLAIVYGLRFAFSAFFVAILDEFGWGRAETSLIFSLNVLVYGATVPVAGLLVDRFGPRLTLPLGVLVLCLATAAAGFAQQLWHFYAIIGVVAALGTAIGGFINFAVMITTWFEKARGTALGFTLAGNGMSFLLVSVAQVLIAVYGWRSAYMMMGIGLGAVLLPFAIILPRGRPESLGLRPDGLPAVPLEEERNGGSPALDPANSDPTLGEAVRDYRYWCLFLANMTIWGFGFSLIVSHQIAYARDGGVETFVIATVVAIYGFANITGNMAGFLSDRIGRELTYTLGGAAGFLAVIFLLMGGTAETSWLLFIYGPLYGLAMGVISPTQIAATADLFGGRHFGKIQGLIVAGFGVGGSVGPWLGGFIFDTMGSYTLAFAISLAAIAFSCAMVWLAAPRRGRRPRPTPLPDIQSTPV